MKLGLESHVYTPPYPYRVSRQRFLCCDLPFSNDQVHFPRQITYFQHMRVSPGMLMQTQRSSLREADGLPERSTLRAAAALLSLPLCGPQQPVQGGETWVLPCGWQGHQVAKNSLEGVWASPAVTMLGVVRGHPRLTLPPSPVLMVQPPAEAMGGTRTTVGPEQQEGEAPTAAPAGSKTPKAPGIAKSRGGVVPVSNHLNLSDSLPQVGSQEKWQGARAGTPQR